MVLLPKQVSVGVSHRRQCVHGSLQTAPCADSEQLVELIDRVQNTRLNDQRCVMKKSGTGQSDTREPRTSANTSASPMQEIERFQAAVRISKMC